MKSAAESSVSLDTFKDAQGPLDDVKLINAFNDEKAASTRAAAVFDLGIEEHRIER